MTSTNLGGSLAATRDRAAQLGRRACESGIVAIAGGWASECGQESLRACAPSHQTTPPLIATPKISPTGTLCAAGRAQSGGGEPSAGSIIPRRPRPARPPGLSRSRSRPRGHDAVPSPRPCPCPCPGPKPFPSPPPKSAPLPPFPFPPPPHRGKRPPHYPQKCTSRVRVGPPAVIPQSRLPPFPSQFQTLCPSYII